MDFAKKVVELVGFDIVFLGSLVIAWVCLARTVWVLVTTDTPPSKAFEDAFAGHSALLTRLEADPTKGFDLPKVVVVALLASVGGMVINIAADELLDWGQLPFLSNWEEDDRKESAAEDALFLDVLTPAQQVVASHTHGDRVQALVQHANAVLVDSSRQKTMTLLGFEFLVVKTLRVVWLLSLLLAVVALAALVHDAFKKRLRLGRVAGVVFAAVFVSSVSLLLWGEQSKRYYLKLLHAYMASSEAGLVVPRAGGLPQVHVDLSFPGELFASEEFRNAPSEDGTISMYEFSAVAVVGDKMIVADNETDRLASDANDLALFEAALDEDAKKLTVARAWPAAFAGVEFDDIEGLAERDGALYMIGSHSLNADGELRPKRHVLMRMRATADTSTEPPAVYAGLMKALTDRKKEKDPDRATTLGLTVVERGNQRVVEDLNIEGLAFVPGTNDLLLGLRAPLINGKAVVLRLSNVDGLFDPSQDLEPMITLYACLDLDGQGISALEYDATRKVFVVAATPPRDVPRDRLTTSVWEWQDNSEQPGVVETHRFVGHRLEGIAKLPQNRWMLAFDEDETPKGGPSLQFGRLVVVNAKPGGGL
jgi:hypothetical protein